MEALQTAPETSSFVLLADHQSRTPASFHSGPAVLHYHSKRCQLSILESDLTASPLNALRTATDPQATANGSTESEPEPKEVVIDGVDVWVTSDKFLLYNPTLAAGVSIPYPSISLHAIQRLRLPTSPDEEVQGLYMQIATPPTAASAAADDEEECMTMTVIPPSEPQQQEQAPNASEDEDKETPTQKLYGAVSACSNLHPDPMEEDDDDEEGGEESIFQSGVISMGSDSGGLPPPVDGSSGWITAENMHEYFDEEGNWIAGGEEPSLSLGPGAGTVRAREDEDHAMDGEGDQEEKGDAEETKWRRTD
ncbi:hypothetical protein FE257_004810 [Aspergillus nanangensis]|uniref:Regulator of volume decrease after cellular swelling-domain-containing protein n=1 Tax=Aspergillus nanangensis TaxID=2582783 RepID=A0AAD4CRI5_ASPNN|nr:hypothetical protein FE257_004810 [Aspergillus nanangensis]